MDTGDSPDPQAGGSTSDFGGSAIPCPCAAFQSYREPPVAVRVSLEARIGDDRFSLRLQEMLAGSLPFASGELFEATWDGTLPCNTGCSDVAVGDEAFGFYWPECPSRERCLADCNAENAANGEHAWELPSDCSATHVDRGFDTGLDCDQECERTMPACMEEFMSGPFQGRVRLAPWSDPLVFARTCRGEISVAIEDLDELWPTEDLTPAQIAACVERFGDWTDVFEGSLNGA